MVLERLRHSKDCRARPFAHLREHRTYFAVREDNAKYIVKTNRKLMFPKFDGYDFASTYLAMLELNGHNVQRS